MDKATFYATKRKEPEYEGVVFEHPAFEGPFRLVCFKDERLEFAIEASHHILRQKILHDQPALVE